MHRAAEKEDSKTKNLLFVLGNATNKESAVVYGHADAEESATPDLIVVHLVDST